MVLPILILKRITSTTKSFCLRIETFQVLLSFANSIMIVNTWSNIVMQTWKPLTIENAKLFLIIYFPSFSSKTYFTITTSYDKLWGQLYNEQTELSSVHGLDWSRIIGTGNGTDGEAVSEGQPIHSFTRHVLLNDGYNEICVWIVGHCYRAQNSSSDVI